MPSVTLDEAQTHLVELVEAALDGELVVITKDGQHIQLVPVPQPTQRPQFGSARGQVWLADDFDAPLADFDAYTQ